MRTKTLKFILGDIVVMHGKGGKSNDRRLQSGHLENKRAQTARESRQRFEHQCVVEALHLKISDTTEYGSTTDILHHTSSQDRAQCRTKQLHSSYPSCHDRLLLEACSRFGQLVDFGFT
jgi:hypothetical protein